MDDPYFLLRQDARPDIWQTYFVEGASLDALRAGIPVDAPAAPARVIVAAFGTVPSDFLELPCPVVSDAMRRALDRAGVDNVEYFPAHVHIQYADVDAPAATDYWVANVVGAVACAAPLHAVRDVDAVQASNAATASGPSRGFRIDSVRAHGFDLFRLAEDRRLFVVSERVAAALTAAGLRGVLLQDPASYTGRRVSTALDAGA